MNSKMVENIKGYVEEGIVNGTLIPIEAIKVAPIKARRGVLGEAIISWSVDEEGRPLKEKEALVTADETGEPGWVATKVDKAGNPIVDQNGNTNDWIIPNDTFLKSYEQDPENPELFKKIAVPQRFVQIGETITFNDRYNGMYTLAIGGFLNVTNLDKIYAVSERDFTDTYKIVSDNNLVR